MTDFGGRLGPLGTRTLLGMLEASAVSGTLFVSHGASASFVLIKRGKALTHTDISGPASGDTDFGASAPFDVDLPGAAFSFWPHVESLALPTLPLRTGSGAAHSAFWALPPLLETPLFSTAETDLRAFIVRLGDEHFSGAVTLSCASTQGLLLFGQGQLCGALCADNNLSPSPNHGAETRARSGMLALRALLQLHEPAELMSFTLPDLLVASLLGLLLNLRQGEDGLPENFSGLELHHDGVRYYRAGLPYLQLTRAHPNGHELGVSGFFSVCPRLPQLKLPTEPSDWEQRRYQLTLRGRDALNPMTELAMRFRGEFGHTGQRTLEQFRSDPRLEEAAGLLEFELGELRTTIERLEADGFIRRQP